MFSRIRNLAVALARKAIVPALTIAALFLLPAVAQAATYNVTRFDDTTGPCTAGDCSLRAAIIAANGNPGHDTINLPPGTYTLTLNGTEGGQANNPNIKDLDILEGVTINGTAGDPNATIIQAGTTPTNGIGRVFDIVMDNTGGKDINTTIQHVTIQHGREVGGTTFYAGGAIQFYAQAGPGTLHVYNSILTQNSASASGGAISAANNAQPGAYVWIDHTAISNNIAGDPGIGTLGGSGGAIDAGYQLGLKIDDSLIQGNTANHGTASTGQGGGIWYWSDPTSGIASYIKNTVIDGNHAVGVGYAGGGGAFVGRPITITNSTVSNNTADDYGGGLVLSTANGDVQTLANVTVSGNSTKTYGGGIYMSHAGSTYNFVNVTVTNNRSDTDNSGTSLGGAEDDSGAGIRRQKSASTGTFNIYNTIVSGNYKGSTGTAANDIDGQSMAFTGTNNMVGTTISGGLPAGGNQLNITNPRLDTLMDNGTAGSRPAWLGPIKTHALLGDSLALDGGSNTYLTSFGLNLTTDARGTGWNRILHGPNANATATVDVGALEMHPSVADTGAVTMLQDTSKNNYNIYVGDASLGINSVTAVSSNPSILPNPTISGAGGTRTMTLTPTLGQSGSVTVTLTATHPYNGVTQSMTDTFTVTVVPRPNLTVTKTHTDPWKQGETGKTYTIKVSNAAGAGPTLAAGNTFGIDPKVTVVDTLPTGLSATAITGTGWNCTLGTLTCDRSDVLAAGASYPNIIVTVTVAGTASASVTNNVTVSGNGDNTPGNNSSADITPILSTNANLSGLALSAGTMSPAFSSGTTSGYTASVANSVTNVNITPTVEDSTASVKVNGNAVTSGSAFTVALNVGSNTITVLVTAQDGTTTKTYTVTVTRAAPSSNADLNNLTLDQGMLTPSFAFGTTSYTAIVAYPVASVNVTPTVADTTATVKINGVTATNGSPATVPLNVGANTITVLVTAQDGTTTNIYTVTVNRQAPSSNADLSNLTLDQGTLSPSFASGTMSYTASVAYPVTSMNVTPTVADTTATVKINGVAATSGSAGTVALNVGSNTITVLVTAQDGTTQKTYTVTVTRQAPSSNADLTTLTLDQGTLSPAFSSGTTSGYTASVAYLVTSINVTPTVADSTATLMINGVTVGSATVNLSVGANTITVLVTAQDGTTKTYTVTVTRQSLSNNADLNNLTLDQGTLSPAFASGTTSYTASVGNAVSNMSLTPTLADNTATVKVNGNAVISGNAATVNLNVGSNTITVLLTAQDGATKTYTVTVTRALSSNAALSSLTIDRNALTPSFTPSIPNYTANLPNTVSSLQLSLIKADQNETVSVTGAVYSSVTGNVYSYNANLNVGVNLINIQVAAQDGTSNTYTINVSRAGAASDNADLSGLMLSSGTLSPVFSSVKTNYSTQLPGSVSGLTVTASVYDRNATLTVNGAAVASGHASGIIGLHEGSNTITVVVTAQDGQTQKKYMISVIRASEPNTPGDPPANPAPSPSGTINISADGKIDEKELKEALSVKGRVDIVLADNQAIIPVSALAANANKEGAALVIHTDNATYILPLSALPSDAMSNYSNISITIKKANDQTAASITKLSDELGGAVLANPIDFAVTAQTKDGRTVTLAFDQYVSREVTLNQQPDASHATGAWYEESTGTMRFVPAIFETKDGKPVVTLKRKGNSVYTVLSLDKHFSDVIGHWAKSDIELLANKLVIDGRTASGFEPEQQITRAEFAALIVRALGLDVSSKPGAFRDISMTDWYANFVSAAAAEGIVNGYSDGTFHPNAPITREELAAMVIRAASKVGTKLSAVSSGGSLESFTDNGKITWGKSEITAALDAGILNGITGTTLGPDQNATRAQATVILKRFLVKVAFIN